jgi:hypothetical protein
LPRLASPSVFACLWIVLGLLGAGAAAAWFTRLPVFATGIAVVVDGPDGAGAPGPGVALVAFVPAQNLSPLRVGHALLYQAPTGRERRRAPIVWVEPQVMSPAEARRRFALGEGAAAAITEPAVVAVARLEPVTGGPPLSAYVGSVYRVEIEVGSRRPISLLPIVGRLFEE